MFNCYKFTQSCPTNNEYTIQSRTLPSDYNAAYLKSFNTLEKSRFIISKTLGCAWRFKYDKPLLLVY